MAHVYPDPLPCIDCPHRNRAVRLVERANQVAWRLRVELRTMSCPMPAYREQRARSSALTGAALGASVTCLLLLTRLALRPRPGRPDLTLTRLLQRRHSRLVTWGMMVLSAPGFAPLQHALTVGTALDLWAFGHRREALFTMLSMGAGATTGVIKIAVGRPRPDPTYMRVTVHFRDKSFPSGHCTHYASFYGYLFYLARRSMAPSALRSAILAACAGLIILVAPSRVYLGHHWASDALAGDLVGLTYLFLLIKAYESVGVR